MTDEPTPVGIYVLPTEPGLPPRALIGTIENDEMAEGMMAVWSSDTGQWQIAGLPVNDDLNQAITAHACDLGVPGFVT
jgi:hypothetical protein